MIDLFLSAKVEKKTRSAPDRMTVNPDAGLVAQAEALAREKWQLDDLTAEYEAKAREFKAALLAYRDAVCEEQPSRHTPSIDIPLPGGGKVQGQFRRCTTTMPTDVAAELAGKLSVPGLLETKAELKVKPEVLTNPVALAALKEKLGEVFSNAEFRAYFAYTEVVQLSEQADKLQFHLPPAERETLRQHKLTPVLAVIVKK